MFEIEIFLKYKQFILIGVYILIGIVSFLITMFVDYYEEIKAGMESQCNDETIYKYTGNKVTPPMWVVVGLFWPLMVPISLFIYIACKWEGRFDKLMVSIIFPKIKKDK